MPSRARPTAIVLCLTCRNSGGRIGSSAFASGITRCSGGPGIELRGPDVAVLTLQPEQPLNYLPGQRISVQTPHWPRLWRTYSIANIPRPDGLLRLHVRAVTGGLVSPVLVHQVLYYGARWHQDLYDLPALREMELIYPWLQVIPAVSDEPAHDH